MGRPIALLVMGFFALGAAALGGAGGARALTQCGTAAWYAIDNHTANGERMDPDALTAAHRTLPFGTWVHVTNLGNGRTVTVRINDRGPFGGGRVIDLSQAAARALGFIASGTARVRLYAADGSSGFDFAPACS